jgi:hypothetical protein
LGGIGGRQTHLAERVGVPEVDEGHLRLTDRGEDRHVGQVGLGALGGVEPHEELGGLGRHGRRRVAAGDEQVRVADVGPPVGVRATAVAERVSGRAQRVRKTRLVLESAESACGPSKWAAKGWGWGGGAMCRASMKGRARPGVDVVSPVHHLEVLAAAGLEPGDLRKRAIRRAPSGE